MLLTCIGCLEPCHKLPIKKLWKLLLVIDKQAQILGSLWYYQYVLNSSSFGFLRGMEVCASIDHSLHDRFDHDHHKLRRNDNVSVPWYVEKWCKHLNLFCKGCELQYHLLLQKKTLWQRCWSLSFWRRLKMFLQLHLPVHLLNFFCFQDHYLLDFITVIKASIFEMLFELLATLVLSQGHERSNLKGIDLFCYFEQFGVH